MLCVFNLTTQSKIYISARNEQVQKTIVALTPIFGKILLDKDWPFFCPHINAITSTLRILFYILVICETTSVRSSEGFKISARVRQVQWLQTHCGQALIFLGKSLSKDMLFLCPQWSSGPYISRNFLIWTHFLNASWKKSDLLMHI